MLTPNSEIHLLFATVFILLSRLYLLTLYIICVGERFRLFKASIHRVQCGLKFLKNDWKDRYSRIISEWIKFKEDVSDSIESEEDKWDYPITPKEIKIFIKWYCHQGCT